MKRKMKKYNVEIKYSFNDRRIVEAENEEDAKEQYLDQCIDEIRDDITVEVTEVED